jgi:hypothetical protein
MSTGLGPQLREKSCLMKLDFNKSVTSALPLALFLNKSRMIIDCICVRIDVRKDGSKQNHDQHNGS